MTDDKMTFGQGCGALVICLLVITAMTGVWYMGSVAMFDSDEPPSARNGESAESITARVEAWKSAQIYRSETQQKSAVWTSPGVLSRAGIGTCIGICVSVVGVLIWRFAR